MLTTARLSNTAWFATLRPDLLVQNFALCNPTHLSPFQSSDVSSGVFFLANIPVFKKAVTVSCLHFVSVLITSSAVTMDVIHLALGVFILGSVFCVRTFAGLSMVLRLNLILLILTRRF